MDYKLGWNLKDPLSSFNKDSEIKSKWNLQDNVMKTLFKSKTDF